MKLSRSFVPFDDVYSVTSIPFSSVSVFWAIRLFGNPRSWVISASRTKSVFGCILFWPISVLGHKRYRVIRVVAHQRSRPMGVLVGNPRLTSLRSWLIRVDGPFIFFGIQRLADPYQRSWCNDVFGVVRVLANQFSGAPPVTSV